MRAQFLPWPFARAIHSHRVITNAPEAIASVMSVFRSLTWAGVRVGFALRSSALVSPMRSAR